MSCSSGFWYVLKAMNQRAINLFSVSESSRRGAEEGATALGMIGGKYGLRLDMPEGPSGMLYI